MARQKPTTQRYIDLDRFVRLCEYVDKSSNPTLTELAPLFGITPSGLSLSISRLEEQYGDLVTNRNKRMAITEQGRAILRHYQLAIDSLVTTVDTAFTTKTRDKNVLSIGASPFLLAHLLPYVISDFLDAPRESNQQCTATYRDLNLLFTLREAYEIDETIDNITSGVFDCAVVWGYDNREARILERKSLMCFRASRPINAVVIFNRDHSFFHEKILTAGAAQSVTIAELKDQQLFVLEEGHQPFYERLLQPTSGGRHIEQTSILSMITAIRMGFPAVAIICGLVSALDRYRRDGSLFSLPLVEDDKKPLTINLLYVLKHPDKAWTKASAPLFKDSDIRIARRPSSSEAEHGIEQNANNAVDTRMQMTYEFLAHFDKLMSDKPFEDSGWNIPFGGSRADGHASNQEALQLAFADLDKYTYVYHVTSAMVGIFAPAWIESTVNWKQAALDRTTKRPVFKGITTTPKLMPDNDNSGRFIAERRDQYELMGRLIGNQVINITGNIYDIVNKTQITANDSFVASLYITSHDGPGIVGVWSGLDDSGQTPLTAPFILSQRALSTRELRNAAYLAMIRTLTDVRALPPESVSIEHRKIRQRPSPPGS